MQVSSLLPGTSRASSRAPSAPRREETQDSERAGRTWARTVREPWDPCFLTLDGGGIRGYSSLIILKELMHEIWEWEKHYEEHPEYSEAQHISEGPVGNTTATIVQESSGKATSEDELLDQGGEHQRLERAIQGMTGGGLLNQSAEQDMDEGPAVGTSAPGIRKKAMSEEELLPCHYFDFMYGTSTGGLIATILGRLRMTVPEGLELYRKVGDDLFGKRRSRVPLMTKYYHEPLERAVKDIVGSRCRVHENCDGNDLHPWEADHFDEILQQAVPFDVDAPRVCQSCCLTATHDQNISEAYLLRSYAHYYSGDAPNWITRYNEGADRIPIWKVCRATTAAPFYFEMLEAMVEDVQKSFKDGGIRENNPSGAALSEFHALYEGRAVEPALMLSVGTGRPDQSHDGFAAVWPTSIGRLSVVSKLLEKLAVIQNLLIKYTEGEKQHKQMREYAHGEHTWYKRLNVSKGLENMPLDLWERGDWTDQKTGQTTVVPGGASLTKMEQATAEYLERDFDPLVDSYARPNTMLRQAAQKLVLQRRAREAEGGPRWEAFIDGDR